MSTQPRSAAWPSHQLAHQPIARHTYIHIRLIASDGQRAGIGLLIRPDRGTAPATGAGATRQPWPSAPPRSRTPGRAPRPTIASLDGPAAPPGKRRRMGKRALTLCWIATGYRKGGYRGRLGPKRFIYTLLVGVCTDFCVRVRARMSARSVRTGVHT